MKTLTNIGIGTGILLALAIVLGIFFRLMCVNFVDNYEFAYMYDTRTGQLTSLNRTGYIVSWPILEKVHTIDMRPCQVSISANSRVLNAKLVQFDTAGWRQFIAWHGRNDYYVSSGGNGGTYLPDILMCYAYDGSNKRYPFLKVLRELKNDDAKDTVQPKPAAAISDTSKTK